MTYKELTLKRAVKILLLINVVTISASLFLKVNHISFFFSQEVFFVSAGMFALLIVCSVLWFFKSLFSPEVK